MTLEERMSMLEATIASLRVELEGLQSSMPPFKTHYGQVALFIRPSPVMAGVCE